MALYSSLDKEARPPARPPEERSLKPKITAVKTNEFLNAKEFGNNLHTNAVIQYSGEFELIG